MIPTALLAINDFTTLKLIGALIIGAYWLINYLRARGPNHRRSSSGPTSAAQA